MSTCARSIRRVPGITYHCHVSFSGPSRSKFTLQHLYPRSTRSLVTTSRRRFCWKHLAILVTKILSGLAISTTPHSTATDPAEIEALQCLEHGTQKLEEGDVEAAKRLYKRSVEIKRNASSLFNLGVTHYHLSVSTCLWFVIAVTYNHTRGIRRCHYRVERIHRTSAIQPGRSHEYVTYDLP
jgi:hypothetical protein